MELIGKIKDKAKKAWSIFLDFVFPRQCLSCQKEGEYVCSACFDKIELLEKFPCFLCHSGSYEEGICPHCRKISGIDRIIISCRYSDNLAGRMVESLKFSFLESLSEPLSQLLIKQIKKKDLKEFLRGGVIVPVPLAVKRLCERGFNQSELIAGNLALKLGCKVCSNLLKRNRETHQQALLSRQERMVNIKGAFSCEAANYLLKVILLDDVLTSGATLTEAAYALKKAGVKEVICLAVCHG